MDVVRSPAAANALIYAECQGLPKVELHVHLDCSLSYAAARSLLPGLSISEYRARFVAPENCSGLAAYLDCVRPGVELLQAADALRSAAIDLVEQLSLDHVLYAEVRFAPLLHTCRGLAPEAAVEAVLDGLHFASRRVGMSIGLILCTLRQFSEIDSLRTADLVERYANSGVVALDLASDEAAYPLDKHVSAFARLNAAGLNTIAHAGEAKGAESVIETVTRLTPRRIGHGVRAIEDQNALELLLKRHIHLEICPSCNVRIGVVSHYAAHPIELLRQAGVSLGVNTDARTTASINLVDEYAKLSEVFGWSREIFLKSNLQAIDASFASDNVKHSIRQLLVQRYTA